MDELRNHWKNLDNLDDRAGPVLNGLILYIHHEGKDRGNAQDLLVLAYVLLSCMELIEKYLDGEQVDENAPLGPPERLPLDWERFAYLLPRIN